MRARPGTAASLALILGAISAGCYATHHYSQIRERRDQGLATSLAASLSIVAGEVSIHPGAVGVLYDLRLRYCRSHFAPRVTRETEGGAGVLRAGLRRRHRSGETVTPRDERNEVDLALSPDVPVDLALDLGHVRSSIQLGGLHLARLSLASGTGRVTVAFDRPTEGDLTTFRVDGGAGLLRLRGLGNASPASLVLSAGSGTFDLDLGGAWRHDARVRIDVRLGDVILRLPGDLGVVVIPDGRDPGDLVLPGFTCDEQGAYRRPSRQEGAPQITVEIGPGLGLLEARIEG
jgi:N-terminal domain of toast_rack, DUF2154